MGGGGADGSAGGRVTTLDQRRLATTVWG